MKIPDYEREDPGELEGLNNFFQSAAEKLGIDVPELQPLMDRITRQVEFLTQALSRRLNPGDNFNSDIRTLDFTDQVPRTIKPRVAGPVKDVRIRQTFPRGPFLVPRMLDWATTGPGEIQVVIKWDTAPTDPIAVEIVIEGD